MEFHGTSLLTWKSSMEFHGTSGEFHGIPWNSMELWNIDINQFHNWGSVFHCFLYDFMSLYIRQPISSWNMEIFQFQSNFLVPLILVKWRYSILNGGLFEAYNAYCLGRVQSSTVSLYNRCAKLIEVRNCICSCIAWWGHAVEKLPTFLPFVRMMRTSARNTTNSRAILSAILGNIIRDL